MKIKCHYCNVTVQTRKEYSKHLEMHKEYNFTCPECGKKFYSLKRFREHKEVHQPKSQCETCNSSFSYKTGLRRHQRQFHSGSLGQMKIKCRYCNATVQTRKEYSKHLEMHKKYGITCPECGKTFYSSRGFRHHEDAHQPQSQCEICNNSFSYTTTLQQHKRLKHGITDMKKYECPHINCNATMQGKIEYNEHFQTHDKPFRYQCKHTGCGKEFHTSSSLSIHKNSCKRKPQSPTETNPQLGHTLANTRNNYGQSSLGQPNYSDVKKHKCSDISCNATIRGTIKCLEHLQKHDEHCKQPGIGEESRSQSPLYRHKKFRQYKPQSPTKRNPHIQKHDEHCKQPGNGEEFRSQSPFYRHKKFRQRKPQSKTNLAEFLAFLFTWNECM
ncbi:hypothetical protein LOAG_18914 [Loa loa]|uniref:C2H2-type domain-containing protein n=1 Tax=Loa loa TaxID=7209 RepID=A0A1S0UFP8_LOALO|nr:hypothetical protein LOAG_18914 [Loa loa]EJD73674.1 hypothetical protein LOAG_18914 [Loa loa]